MKHTFALTMMMTAAIAIAQPVQTVKQNLFDSQTKVKWSNARDAGRLNKEFVHATHDIVNGMVDWKFAPRPGTRFNDLFLNTPINAPFSRITATIANPGADFVICAKIKDSIGVEWTLPTRELKHNDQFETFDFNYNDFAIASWNKCDPYPMSFPLSFFCIIAYRIEDGKEYNLIIKEVSMESSFIDITKVNGFACPQTAVADSQVPIQPFTVETSQKLNQPTADFRVMRDDICVLHTPVKAVNQNGNTIAVTLENPLKLSWLMRQGNYQVALYLNGKLDDGTPNVTASRELAQIAVQQVNTAKADVPADVRIHNGVPTLFVNGTPHSGMAAAAYAPYAAKFENFTSADVDLFTICSTPTEGYPGLATTTWLAPDKYDYSQLDHRVETILNANRNAKIFPRLYLHTPLWWSEKHPDDVVIAETPEGQRQVFKHRGIRPAPSWASKAWREDTAEGLRRLVHYVETSPYASNFVGYHLASGTTEEWMMWGANENVWVDYSKANLTYFRTWLRDKYKTDKALQAAWKRADVTFDTAEIPTYKQRNETKNGDFRDPQAEQQVIEFYLYNSWMVADTISYFAKVVKDATKRQKTVGVFYGYTLQLNHGQRLQNAGHLALEKVLASPDIDFVCSPTSYCYRQLGGLGTCHFMAPVDSVKRHGKLWFDENDVRTSISPGKLGDWGKPANILPGDKIQQDKELACVITNGVAQWWFDVGSNIYEAPDLRDIVKNLARVGQEAISLNRTPNTQMGLFIDSDSLTYLKVGNRLGLESLLAQLPNLHRAGRSVAHYLTSDLAAAKDHRVVIMACSYNPSDETRRQLEALKGDNRVIVFFHGNGVVQNDVFNAANIKAFTGINVKQDAKPLEDASATFTGDHPLCKGLNGKAFGHPTVFRMNPVLIPDDPEATVLASFKDGRPAIVAKKFANWTAVYCAQMQLPIPFWRNLADVANAHSYIDTADVVYANESMLSVVPHEAGKRIVRLPKPAIVHEMITNRPVTTVPVASFEYDFTEDQTAIFKLIR